MADKPLIYLAYAVSEPSLNFQKLEFIAPPLIDDHVTIEVICNGICHSDCSSATANWVGVGIKHHFPLCPGHEVIGVVTELGPNCTLLKVGDRVGVGPQRSSCLANKDQEPCELCTIGETQLCRQKVGLYGTGNPGGTGGFGSFMRISEKFAYQIPENMTSEEAAPLLCAAVTCFSPLYRFNLTAKPRSKVCVIGIGGLGHLAISIAAAMGHEVTVITRSADKEKLCKQLGATHFFTSTKENMAANQWKYDFVLSTIANNTGCMDEYIKLTKPRHTICYLGIGQGDLYFNPTLLLFNDISLSSSDIGGIFLEKEMLKFCSQHNIKPMISVINVPFDEEGSELKVKEACEGVEKGLPRFRYVLNYKKEIAKNFPQYVAQE